MRHYFSVDDAMGALSLDTGFDPFSGRRPTREKLASLGYPVDPVAAAREFKAANAKRAADEADAAAREMHRADWAAQPSTKKYAAAANLLGGGPASMVEIGDRLAHVRRLSDGIIVVVCLIDGQWIARRPNAGEKLYA